MFSSLGRFSSGLARAAVAAALSAGLVLAAAGTAQAQQASIELSQTSGDTTTYPDRQVVLSTTATLQNNTDNPTGNTFSAVPGTPTTVTYTILNNRWTNLPTATYNVLGAGLYLGSQAGQNMRFSPLSGIGSPANNMFTSLPTVTGGIDVNTNYGARVAFAAAALLRNGASNVGRHYLGDLRISFSQPVANPVLHFGGMGGNIGTKGFSSEFSWNSATDTGGATSATRLSGNGSSFVVSTAGTITQINNGSGSQGASCATGAGACGSVQFFGDGITSITLQVFAQSDDNVAWAGTSGANALGQDVFHVSVSTETADMTPAFSGLPTQVVPGVTYPATLTCTNLGPNFARDAECLPTASVGTVDNVVCTPPVPAAISYIAPNNKTVCTFNYTLPVGVAQSNVVFTGQAWSGNDRNGGEDPAAGNNQVQATVPVRAPRLRAVKVLNGTPGRDLPTDQFTLTIAGGGGPTASATTSGSGNTVTGGAPVLATATAGQGYTLSEAVTGGANAANYTTAYSCVNALAGSTTIASGTGTSITTPALAAGDDITCTFTNTYTNTADLVTTKTLGGAAANPVNTGDTVTFLISVNNAGPGTARNVQLTDLLPAGMTAAAGNGAVTAGTYVPATGLWTIPSIPPGATRTLTLVGTVNADQGGVTITNTIPAAPTSDTIDPNPNGNDLTETVDVTAAPEMGVVKTSAYSDFNANGRQDAGDRITYTYVVTNRGNTRLDDVVLTEEAATFTGTGTLPTPALTVGGADLDGQADEPDLAFGGSMTFSATYDLTQLDIDAGVVSNQVLASASGPGGTPVTDLSHPSDPAGDTPTDTPLTPVGQIGTVKTSAVDMGGDGILNAGDTITYTYVVTNTGATTINNVGVTEVATSFTGSGPDPVPAYASGGGDYDSGDGTPTDIRPLETVTFTASYTITQPDIDAGTVTNQALGAGTTPTGGAVSDPSDDDSSNPGEDTPTQTPLATTPKIELTKTASFDDVNGNGRADAGDRITYAFAVENTGPVTVTNISVTDPLPGISVSGTIATLAPGATDSTSITGQYTLTQDDVDAGQVQNQAIASGTSPTGQPATDQSDDPLDPNDAPDTDGDPGDPTVQLLPAEPEMTLDKRTAAGAPATVNAVGQVLNYEFEITNSGNVTIDGPFAIQDNKITTPITCPLGPLAPGASLICTGSYSVVQADLNDGAVANTANAVEDVVGTAVPPSDPDTFTVPAIQNPALTIDKSAPVIPAVDFNAGLVVPYTYVVTNSGNVTITDPITVSDNRVASVSCPALPVGGLAPLASITCTANYTVTAGDVGQTRVTNLATATDGDVTSPPDEVTIPQNATPGLTIEKSLAEVNGDTNATAFANAGDVVVYEYLVRNSGTAAYAADVVVNDNKFPAPIVCFNSQGGTLTFPPYTGTPGVGEITCQSEEYTILQSDVEANQVTNVAAASSVYGAGTENPSVVTSSPDSVTVPGTPDNKLTVAKTAVPAFGAGVGDTITYTIVVTNSGNQTLNPVTVSDPMLTGLTCDIVAPISLAPGSSVECEGTYVVTQTDVNNELIENTASASGMPPQGSTPVTASGDADHVPEDPANAMTLAKSGAFNDANTNGRADVGETISYSFTVSNTGNQTLNSLAVTDNKLTPALVGTIASLAPGQAQTLTGSYTLTQTDIDAGSGTFVNEAELTAKDPDGADLTPVQDDATVTLPRSPGLSLVKTGVLADTNGDGIDNAGDIITYSFAVTNTGNVTMTDVTLDDTSLPGLTITQAGPIASLAPGATDATTFQATFVLTNTAMTGAYAGPADPNSVRNEATVTGNYDGPLGGLTLDATDDVVVPFTPGPGIDIVKTADTSALSDPPQAGETITYTFQVENTGNVPLSNVTVTDTNPDITFVGAPVAPIASLAPGQVDNTTYTATYVLTTDDFEFERVDNSAIVSALPPNTVTPITDGSSVSTPLETVPRLEILKIADSTTLSTPPVVGDAIGYVIVVKNTGNKRIHDILVNDPMLGVEDYDVGTLEPGEDALIPVFLLYGYYSITQADLDRGYVDNTATAAGTTQDPTTPDQMNPISDLSDDPDNTADVDPNGDGNPDDPTRVLLPSDPKLSLVKAGAFTNLVGTTRPDVGDRITYTFTVKNEGNVTIENISITDPLPGIVLAGGPIASLAPGQTDSTTLTGYVVLTQAMITAGQVENTATVAGEDPAGGPVEDDSHPTDPLADDPTIVLLPQEPKLALVKTGTFTDAGSGNVDFDGNGAANVGEIVTYAFRVTNTGNVPISGVTVTDSGLPGVTVSGGPISLNPGQTSPVGTFTASYVITQANINAGVVNNTAIATGTGPAGPVTDSSHPSSAADGATAPTPVNLPRRPALGLVKSSAAPVAGLNSGDVITYNYVVTNTGNTTITDPVSITDNRIFDPDLEGPLPNPITCGAWAAGGVPGDTMTCVGTYTVTATDLEVGRITNNATATDGTTRSPTSTVTLPDNSTPELTVVKTVVAVNGVAGETTFSVAGDIVTYGFTVTNTGDAGFASDVFVTDNVISPGIGDILCYDYDGINAFNSGAVAVCPNVDYAITQEDLDDTLVTNEVYASAIFVDTNSNRIEIQSPTDEQTVTADLDRSIALTKISDPVSGGVVGQTLTYTLVATNDGNQTLSDVTITDDRLADLTCDIPAPVTLAPNDLLTCTGTYVVTQGDVDDETIPNTADVTSTSPQGTTVTDQATFNHVPVDPITTVTLDKTASAYADANSNSRPDVGEVITYTFVVTNSGNQTLNTVVVDDPNLTPSLVATIASLAPGATQTFTRTYALTQADLNAAGDKHNEATVNAKDPDGVDLTPVTDAVDVPLARTPALTVVKTGVFREAVTAGVQNAGDFIDYTITVTNTGNVTVTDIEVNDVLLGGLVDTIASLAPGASQDVTGSYELVVGDLNAGERANTATATGTTANNGTPPPASDDATVTLTRAPRIALVKSAQFNDVDGSNAASTGDTVTYTYTVTNMGNVTVDAVAVTETVGEFTGTGTLPTPTYVSGGTAAAVGTADLKPAEAAIWTATYALTADDIAAGGVINQANAEGEDPTGAPVTDASDESGQTPTDNEPTEVTYNQPPVAEDDTSENNPIGQPVTINPLVANGGAVDSDPDGTLVAASVRLMDGTNQVTSLTVAGQGTWTVNTTTGAITFTPLAGFIGNPDPVDYVIADNDGAYSEPASVTITYTPAPVANPDESLNNPIGADVIVTLLTDDTVDTASGRTPDVDSVEFTLTGAPSGSTLSPDGKTLTVPGQGVWTVNPGGTATFNPNTGFAGNPTPVNYTFADDQGNRSNPALVTVTYTAAPVATPNTDLNNPIGSAVSVTVLGDDTVDTASGRSINPDSVQLSLTATPAGSTLSPDGKTLTVPNEGVWTVGPTGAVIFTPDAGFTANPTPVNYTFADDQGNRSNEALVTVTYTGAPVATPNTSTGNPIGQPVTVTLLGDDTVDTASGRVIDPTSVELTLTGAPASSTLSPDGKTLTVPGEGVWTVNADGTATFTPEDGFVDPPTPVNYTFADDQGNRSNEATITVTFTDPPIATDNTGEYLPGSPVTINVIDDDSSPSGRPLDPASVQIVGTTGPGQPLVVPGEGTWSVDTTTGSIIFTPETGYTGDPTPIRYTVADDQGNRSNEATVTVVSAGIPEVTLNISVDRTEDTNGDGVFGAGDTVFWKFRITNSGNVPLFSASITNPSLSMPGLSCSLPARYSEPGSPGLLPGESVDLVCVNTGYLVTVEDMARGTLSLTATVVANDSVGQTASSTDAAATFDLEPGGVEITKTAALRNVRAGQLVPYTITVTNLSTRIAVTVNVVDSLPDGMVYREGTGAVGGTTQDPAVSGSRLAFNNVTVPAGGAVAITLSAYVTQAARPGEKVNTVQAFSSLTGVPVSPKATATVMLNADPIFDCGTVIGRVFDDANQDGYMDGPLAYIEGGDVATLDRPIVEDKFSILPKTKTRKVKGGEQGIPGVRLVTVNGTIITTDEFGRFHVPCAELPSDIGSNFLLKLDERTLPTGYRMTTENPRVMRLTAGKMSEMNFGAAISRVVRIELSDAAFVQTNGKDRPRPELEAGLRQLLGQIASTPSNLRIIYQQGKDGERLAKSRMRTVEAMVRDLWDGTGRYKLNVEKEIKK